MALLIAGCNTPAGPDDRWARPENITFAAALDVDLSQMNRTASGLYWQDLTVGTGTAAAVGHQVTVHYSGWFPDGTLFDSSYQRNTPIRFPLGGGLVIRGMDEGIMGMQVGGKRKLVIRPELAYGRGGDPPAIPPLATLIFEVELVGLER